MIKKPGFIVEGDLEKLFIEETCPGRPVRKIGCNGDQVRISEIARRVGTQARMLQKRCDLLVVVFDREGREISTGDIETEFLSELAKENIDCRIAIGISDRQIENWILSDWDNFLTVSGAIATERPLIEGTKGKPLIKQLLPKGSKYVETLQGVDWLKKADPAKIACNSPSFKRFSDQLQEINCWWLHRERLEAQ